MGKFGETAVRAAKLLDGGCESPSEAWRIAAMQVFPDSASSRNKNCPKEAFLGLCASGLIRGIPRLDDGANGQRPNREYAITAARLLALRSGLTALSRTDLWTRVLTELRLDPKKRHNQQMDIVMSLWEQSLINEKRITKIN
jgi:hypothetical protein